MQEIEEHNPLHDIKSDIAYEELVEIDLDELTDKQEPQIETHLRSLAERASIGQLRLSLDMSFDDADLDRAVLIDRYVERRMGTVRRMRAFIRGENGL
jgi:hypothetical protein